MDGILQARVLSTSRSELGIGTFLLKRGRRTAGSAIARPLLIHVEDVFAELRRVLHLLERLIGFGERKGRIDNRPEFVLLDES